MSSISVGEAQATLPELIHRLTPGQEVLLTEDDRPVAKLVATASEPPNTPKLGTQRGSVAYVAPDFDAPLDDFKEYME
jgi:antitoxin (DNA-binding transcriptional repressor) of toxin-antitoxin stability system